MTAVLDKESRVQHAKVLVVDDDPWVHRLLEQKLAQAHTGALAGGGETYAALFRRYGVRQVRTLDEMMDTVELFSKIQRIERSELAMLMESGGERSMVADHATYIGVEFAEFSAETNARLTATLDEGRGHSGPSALIDFVAKG